MYDEQPREKNVPLGKARAFDIARRSIVGVHKRKATNEAGSVLDQTASELDPFEYDKKCFNLTNRGSLFIAYENEQYEQILNQEQISIAPGAPGSPNLPPIPGNWLVYGIPKFLEGGIVKRLTVRSTYLAPLPGGMVDFLIALRSPTDPLFTPEDIIVGPAQLMFPMHGVGLPSANFGDMEMAYDQKVENLYLFEYPRIDGQNNPLAGGPRVGLSIPYTMYFICEEWRSVPGTDILRLYAQIEDRGR